MLYAQLDDSFAAELVSLRDEVGKPIFIVPGMPIMQEAGMSLLIRHGIPTFTIPERALKVLAAMVSYSDYLHQSS